MHASQHQRSIHLDVQTNRPQEKLVLNYREAAAALNCCERMVWQMCRDGRLKTVRYGRSVRIPRTQIEQFLELNTGR